MAIISNESLNNMPTILLILGWRLHFYANEGNEPIHVHCTKGDADCKFWLNRENFDIQEAYAYNLTVKDRRQIRKIVLEHFEYIEEQWDNFQNRKQS
jgi:hypothetical protein